MIDIGIIGAMEPEIEGLVASLTERRDEVCGSILFHLGKIGERRVVVARCGIGKVFAAMCCEAMIIKYSPRLIVNTGVGGALNHSLRPTDIVIGDRVFQHDMDTSPFGDPKGLISGINKVYLECDRAAREILISSAKALSLNAISGDIATGDQVIASNDKRRAITDTFGGDACEMEGGAIAQAAYANGVPFVIVRAISDSADGEASLDYPKFLKIAADNSLKLTLELIKRY
jgi:adenosylhomocysteine nucleosidase